MTELKNTERELHLFRVRLLVIGVLGFPVRTLDGWRIGGALLVIAGVFLLARR